MGTKNALLLSIRPRFAEMIFSGLKTVELRRVKPRLQQGDLVVIYASGATKAMVGAFEVGTVTADTPDRLWEKHNQHTGLCKKEFDHYFLNASQGYAIGIHKAWRVQHPVSLNTLRKRRAGFRAPQSYHYWSLEELLEVGGEGLSLRVHARRGGRTLRQ